MEPTNKRENGGAAPKPGLERKHSQARMAGADGGSQDAGAGPDPETGPRPAGA